jgi:hypothetical protein
MIEYDKNDTCRAAMWVVEGEYAIEKNVKRKKINLATG